MITLKINLCIHKLQRQPLSTRLLNKDLIIKINIFLSYIWVQIFEFTAPYCRFPHFSYYPKSSSSSCGGSSPSWHRHIPYQQAGKPQGEHSPAPGTAGARRQPRNARCCSPPCPGWRGWHRSGEGTRDTCGQFTGVNVGSQDLTGSSLAAAGCGTEIWQRILYFEQQITSHQQLLTFTMFLNRKSPLLFEDQLHGKDLQPNSWGYSRLQN